MACPLWLVLAWLLLFMRECVSELDQPWGPLLGLADPGKAGQSLESYNFYSYTQTIDHFNYKPESYITFQQRYAVDNRHWGGADTGSPIFVYTGGEECMESSIKATGIMDDFGSTFKALVVYIEHRYYGESVPFGSEARQNASKGYLSSTQALADYAELIRSLKTNYSAENCPVIAVGGSYGGMLASWLRLKYPHIVNGALASSAPVLYFEDITPENGYYVVVSKDYNETSETCYLTIRQSWFEIDNYMHELDLLTEKFKLCRPLECTTALKYYLEDMFVRSAQYDNPPTYPVKTICDAIDGAPQNAGVLERIFAAVVAIKGNLPCYDISPYGLSTSEGWRWQRCTEMVMPMGRGKNDTMFQERPFNLTAFTENCKSTTGGVAPRPHWITTEFGGHDIDSVLKNFASNVIYTNGLRDPYSAGGVLRNISDSVVAIYTEQGAHCVDLWRLSRNDPIWLDSQKRAAMEILRGWIADYNAKLLQGAVNKPEDGMWKA